jgi:predicted Zn-dependent peptidase
MMPAWTPARSFSEALREEIQSLVLPSGLRVYFCPKPGFKKRYACYAVHYGSVDSEFSVAGSAPVRVPDGIAHFLEHTLFETEEGNVSDLFARNGAYNNAATSFTTTTYLFACTTRFYENLELLIRFVENPVFRPDKVEKEKGIIEQEIRGYDDSPGWVSYMGLLENLFVEHPIRIDIAGTVETIRKIDSEALHRSYRAFYHPANMILFIIGDLDPAELFGFVSEKSRHGGAGGTGECETGRASGRVYPEEPPGVFRRETRKDMEVAVPKLLLGFKEVRVPMVGRDFVLNELASDLALEMLFGPSSDTFRELYEAQLILDDFAVSYGTGAGVGHAVVGGDTPRPDALREALLSKVSRLVGSGFPDEDFEREKRRFMGSFIRAFNSLEHIANNYTHYRFHDFDLFDSIALLAAVDKERLEERARALMDPRNYASFVVTPK